MYMWESVSVIIYKKKKNLVNENNSEIKSNRYREKNKGEK